ncbi:hypothetical protein PHMEG_00030715 [Phytophthora megakarya]|uniref:Uncharacterized protein n=1 Tax=Phytophthora megakarya TaxID=4795 RepID=A0A225V0L6_9STRA|nr:hypothetical protein PHMEG_00030715 [Phytophthora megakarya]
MRAALIRGVRPLLSGKVTLAPSFSRNCTTSKRPFSAAQLIAVNPSTSSFWTSCPFSTKNCTTSR